MNVQTPAARNTDPATSHEAAEAITSDGTRQAQQEVVLLLVERYPGLTSAELASKTRILDRYQTARRLPELEGFGVAKGDARKCSVTGRKAVTWWPA